MGVIGYIKYYFQAYEIRLEREAGCNDSVWCNIVTRNSTLPIRLVYRSPNINEEDNTTKESAMKEVNKGNVLYWEIVSTNTY